MRCRRCIHIWVLLVLAVSLSHAFSVWAELGVSCAFPTMAAVDPAALLSAQLEDIIGGGGAGGKIILPPPTTAAAMMQAGVNAAGVSGSLGGSTVFRAGGMPLPAAFGWAQEGMAPRVPLVPTVLQGQPAHTLPQDPMWWMETCPAKTGISFIVGGGLGLVTGIVLGGWQSYAPPMPFPGAPEPPRVRPLAAVRCATYNPPAPHTHTPTQTLPCRTAV